MDDQQLKQAVNTMLSEVLDTNNALNKVLKQLDDLDKRLKKVEEKLSKRT